MFWETLLRVLVSGIANGAIYASVAVGFSIIYRSGKVFNIAQGEMLMLATFMAMTFFGMGMNHWVALALTAIVMALLGLGVERFVLRPLVGQSEMALFMSTLGLLLVLNGLGVIFSAPSRACFPTCSAPSAGWWARSRSSSRRCSAPCSSPRLSRDWRGSSARRGQASS